MYDSLEDAGLDKTQVRKEVENYDMSGDPQWCSVDDTKILVCDLTIKNLDENSDGDLHIGEFMIAYADPGGESSDMKAAWLIQDGYEPENLYLCVTYDVKNVKDRQYFRLIE